MEEKHYIFEVEDPFKRKVAMKQETWENKIINQFGTNSNKEHGNSHEEMNDYLEEIKDCIIKPNFISKDTKIILTEDEEKIVESENREEYYRFFIDRKNEIPQVSCIKTIVEHNDNIGEVVTTHLMNGKVSKIKMKGSVIYGED